MNRYQSMGALALMALLPGSAGALSLVVDYQATVALIDAPGNIASNLAAAGVSAGTGMTGTFTLDLGVPDLNPGDGTRGDYSTAARRSFSLGMIDGTFVDNEFNFTLIIDAATDTFFTTSEASANFPGTLSPQWGFQLRDSTGSIFDSDALPLGLPLLAAIDPFDPVNAFSGSGVLMSFFDNNDIGYVFAELTSYEATVVPAPGALLLMIGALGTLLTTRRRS